MEVLEAQVNEIKEKMKGWEKGVEGNGPVVTVFKEDEKGKTMVVGGLKGQSLKAYSFWLTDELTKKLGLFF